MIRRDRRHIGKSVRVIDEKSRFFGRIGVVKGFRGDWGKGADGKIVPFVFVMFANDGYGSWPFPGHKLERV